MALGDLFAAERQRHRNESGVKEGGKEGGLPF